MSNVNFNIKKGIFILFINNRLVESNDMKKALDGVYAPYLPKGTHAFIYLKLQIPPQDIDVNVRSNSKHTHHHHHHHHTHTHHTHHHHTHTHTHTPRPACACRRPRLASGRPGGSLACVCLWAGPPDEA